MSIQLKDFFQQSAEVFGGFNNNNIHGRYLLSFWGCNSLCNGREKVKGGSESFSGFFWEKSRKGIFFLGDDRIIRKKRWVQWMKKRRNIQWFRGVWVMTGLLIQITAVLVGVDFLAERYGWIGWGFTLSTFLCVLWLLNTQAEPGFKICWLLVLLPFPQEGGVIFLLSGANGMWRWGKSALIAGGVPYRIGLPDGMLSSDSPLHQGTGWQEAQPQIRFLEEQAGWPAYQKTHTTYYPSGETLLPALLRGMKQAKRYLFLEYFLIREGWMWGQIVDIMRQKVEEGVEVRLIYDDAGCLFTLPSSFRKQMEDWGVRVQVFHPMRPVLSTRLNHRNHRKIMVVDGEIAFTGGVNLSDEYVNRVERFGYWKDGGIQLEGEAAWSMTVMFLGTWSYCSGVTEEVLKFFPKNRGYFQENSFVLPYNDSPIGGESVGQQVFLNLIGKARDRIYMTSPYVMLDTATQSALCCAAKSGVDVRLITPHHGDKQAIFQVTRGGYPPLLSSGVGIYEFTPGFIHSKMVLVDGIFATIGTMNLDFRSMFLHEENGVWLWNDPCIKEMERDFLDTLAFCQRCTYEGTKSQGVSGMLQCILRVFAPLM